MIRVGCLSSLFVVGLLSGAAQAQDAGKVGITMAYPASFGVIWHASDAVAIRPAITYTGASSDSTSTTSGTSNWSLGTAVSALFYLKKYDNVRTYVSPTYRYSHTSTTIKPATTIQGSVSNATSTGNSNGASGTFGAEYAPGTRVRIYGEVGFGYTHTTNSTSIANLLTTTGNSWGTTAGVGFVFYP